MHFLKLEQHSYAVYLSKKGREANNHYAPGLLVCIIIFLPVLLA